jgi:MoxR-like ATPase
MDLDRIRERVASLEAQCHRVVVGQDEALHFLLLALLAEGHVLLEGMPGTAKTLLARTFAAGLALDFKRIQFTPDLMPGDILGTSLFDFRTSEFVLTRGPIFTQVLLADEINRTPPKTQSALLQAMQERAVTIDGKNHDLGPGFLVVATQNPLEQEGTYPLPEAQLDRFLLKVTVPYLEREQELDMVRRHARPSATRTLDSFGLEPALDLDFVLAAREAVAGIQLADEVVAYAVDLVRATREHPALAAGASPRASGMLCLAARAEALLDGRDYVIPDDVKRLVGPVLAHRLVPAPGAELEGGSANDTLAEIVREVEAPR